MLPPCLFWNCSPGSIACDSHVFNTCRSRGGSTIKAQIQHQQKHQTQHNRHKTTRIYRLWSCVRRKSSSTLPPPSTIPIPLSSKVDSIPSTVRFLQVVIHVRSRSRCQGSVQRRIGCSPRRSLAAIMEVIKTRQRIRQRGTRLELGHV